jgi:hypothetical protein
MVAAVDSAKATLEVRLTKCGSSSSAGGSNHCCTQYLCDRVKVVIKLAKT